MSEYAALFIILWPAIWLLLMAADWLQARRRLGQVRALIERRLAGLRGD